MMNNFYIFLTNFIILLQNYKVPGAKDIPVDFRVEMRKDAPNPVGVLKSKGILAIFNLIYNTLYVCFTYI